MARRNDNYMDGKQWDLFHKVADCIGWQALAENLFRATRTDDANSSIEYIAMNWEVVDVDEEDEEE